MGRRVVCLPLLTHRFFKDIYPDAPAMLATAYALLQYHAISTIFADRPIDLADIVALSLRLFNFNIRLMGKQSNHSLHHRIENVHVLALPCMSHRLLIWVCAA